ncbi:LamG domain-containing protein [Candidatus Poribacteria bacterium]|nr:LamG domain-containing protein [Candidatus Poribacteria bacterium]
MGRRVDSRHVALACVVLVSCALTPARAAIVGLWQFEDGGGKEVKDSSGRNHTGTLGGGTKWSKGKYGGVLEFDETGFIEWAHHADFTFTDALTIMVYARIDDITPQEWVEFPRKEGEYTMAAHKLGNTVEMTLWLNIGGGWIGQIPAAGAFPAHKFGEWHHYASTYNGKEARLYFDGKDAGSMAVGGKLAASSSVLAFSRGCCGGRYFKGAADDFMMANNAMSSADIAAIAANGIAAFLAVSPSGKSATTWATLKRAVD